MHTWHSIHARTYARCSSWEWRMIIVCFHFLFFFANHTYIMFVYAYYNSTHMGTFKRVIQQISRLMKSLYVPLITINEHITLKTEINPANTNRVLGRELKFRLVDCTTIIEECTCSKRGTRGRSKEKRVRSMSSLHLDIAYCFQLSLRWRFDIYWRK